MAMIYREFRIEAPIERVWDALADFGALQTKLAPGFVVDCQLEGEVRTVTFGNGRVVQERLVGLDPAVQRLAYAIIDGPATHHQASAQVFSDGDATRFVWITDVLPDSLAAPFGSMMDQGIIAVKKALES